MGDVAVGGGVDGDEVAGEGCVCEDYLSDGELDGRGDEWMVEGW